MTVKEPPLRTRPHTHATARVRRQATRRRRRLGWTFGVLAAIGMTVMVTAALIGGSDTTNAGSVAVGHHATGVLPDGYRLSGETSPMGEPVLVTPGTRSGTATAGGVAIEGADIVMGHIPLAYAVNPTWQLTNTSDHPVTLAKPQLEIAKGCCPGELALGTTTLAPGAQTTLHFPLQMHPGMDGDHLFRIAVPVDGADKPLVLSVAGDFS